MSDQFRSIDPATGDELASFDALDREGLESALSQAEGAFARYRRTTFEERAAWLHQAAELLKQGAPAYGRLMSREMGKPISQAVAEAEKCARVCRYYAERGAELLAEQSFDTEARRSVVRYQPLGAVLAIMPWNFPFWQVIRCAAPALMAGNVILLKHSSNVPQCAIAIEGIFRRAGFPEHAFQNLFASHDDLEVILDHAIVQAASVTGSTRAGSTIAAAAGARIKPTVLELGGSDPFIVCPSADLERAVTIGVKARMQNNGQSCIAAKRFILSEAIADRFEELFVQKVGALTVGDPVEESTDIGPMAREDLRDGLAEQVRDTLNAGARLLVGGDPVEGAGFFYQPTVMRDVPEGSPAWGEELFGPVASLFRVGSADEAIQLANATEFGLGSSVWTEDPEEIERFSEDLVTGQVFFNAMTASHPELPFGGVRGSGYGRELGPHGIREFVNTKTIWVSA